MNRSEPYIVFQFADIRTALDAIDTFEELGYEPSLQEEDADKPQVWIRVINEDLTSALEIGQAFGGILLESRTLPEEGKAYSMAYDLNAGAIETEHPAPHSGDRQDAAGPEPENPDSEEGPLYDVSAHTYDHFSGDVRA